MQQALLSEALGYEYATAPFKHQAKTFEETAQLPYYAIFWEQGTGKTKLMIDNACYLYEQGEIDTLVVVAPNDVHRNWIEDELPVHLPKRLHRATRSLFYQTRKSKTKWFQKECRLALHHRGFLVLAISYDAFMTKTGKQFMAKILRQRKCFYVADESSDIKTPSAKRTWSVVASAKYAKYRRIMDGTPTGGSPFELYSQMRFLDNDFWKRWEIDTYAEFKAHYAHWKTAKRKDDREFQYVTSYRRLNELNAILSKFSNRVLKEEVLPDLPPKLYSKRYFELTAEQQRVYNELRDESMTFLHTGELVTTHLALVKLLRLQQVACGYVPPDDPEAEPEVCIKGDNPRLDTLEHNCAKTPHKGIIWARFRKDHDLIIHRLGKENVVRYDGTLSDDQRAANKHEFKNNRHIQWISANPAAMSRGHTYTEAKTEFFYSNSFKLREREQAEDRAHRAGQEDNVEIIDIIEPNTVDMHIVKSLRKKKDIAVTITGDDLKEWL